MMFNTDLSLPDTARPFHLGGVWFDTAAWLIAFPGLAISPTVLGINQLGDGLRDLLDPHLRGRL